jgi:HNH endonuclease
MKRRSWQAEDLIRAVNSSTSYRQVLKKLGLREAGGNYAQIKKYIVEAGISVSHFRGRGWNRGLKGTGRPHVPLDRLLVLGSSAQSFKLKKRLFNAGLKPMHCEECGWAQTSENGYLPLELDHINGNRYDNRFENLRILCPNCHSLRPTHRSRKRARVAE